MASFLISAAHKSSGKTTVAIGLAAALKARGLTVQPFKKGPDYIDPLWLTQAAGRACRNLDFYTMGREEIAAAFLRHAARADVALIEGNKGLYDGLALDGADSNAALAKLLQVPVVLVIDTRGMTRGIAPLLLGYQDFDRGVPIAGVILNKLGGARHETKLRSVIERYTDMKVVGAIPSDSRLGIAERHLGLVPSNEASDAASKVAAIASMVAASVDLDALLRLAAETPTTAVCGLSARERHTEVRIGIARDSAFGFYYPDDLELLEATGAELVPFDTLTDRHLPAVDGLFIGGGFPELFMDRLEANGALRGEIKSAVEAGLPVYAECGGLMYLARTLTWQGRTCAMVGALPGDAVMHPRPVGRGYVQLQETSDHPWPRAGNSSRAEVRAHEFHYSSLENLGKGARFAYRVLRGHGVDGHWDGIVYKNALASYTHLRSVGSCNWAERFVTFVRQVGASAQQAATQTIPAHGGQAYRRLRKERVLT